jgi:glycosyltransferase involved in cell wall biosynthesis
MRPVVLAPSFPRRADASDGQSVYVVEAAHALAALRGERLQAIALRLGSEPATEADGAIDVERIEPGASIATPFSLYEAAHFERVMERFAREALARIPPGAPVLLHGYELGPLAHLLAARGHRVVAVLHYLLAQESERYLAGAHDAFRRSVMPGALGALGARLPARARAPFVRAASAGARWSARAGLSRVAARLGGPGAIVAHQLAKLAMERQLVRSADVVVGVSAGFADAIRRFYPGARVEHCHAGRPEEVEVAPWTPSARLRLLAVGRPTPQKGWDVLASALAELERTRPEVADRLEVTLVGGGEWAGPHSAFASRTHEALRALRRVEVRDAGRLPHAEVLARYAETDALVLPSDYEPFGLVVLEAMAAGCPVLSFATDGPRDLLADGQSGWLVPLAPWPERARSLAGSLASLATLDEATLRARRRAARARAESFSWSRTAAAHAAWLEGARPPRP